MELNDLEAVLDAARADRDAEVNHLADLNEDELFYLAFADLVDDPQTQGLECNAHEQEGD